MTDNTRTSNRSTQALLTHHEPSHSAGIADAIAIKDENLFFLSEPDGSVPLTRGHGLGLYLHDCRFLSGYEVRLDRTCLERLGASGADGFRSTFRLTNPTIKRTGQAFDRQRIGVEWTHTIDSAQATLKDTFTLENYDVGPHSVQLHLTFRAGFEDVFVVRGLVEERTGTAHPPRWKDGALIFAYDGGDHRHRELQIRPSSPPSRRGRGWIEFDFDLDPGQARTLVVLVAAVEQNTGTTRHPRTADADPDRLERSMDALNRDWLRGFARVTSPNVALDRIVERSLRDLRALKMTVDDDEFFAAGVPWFATLFGRDSLTCALQTLAFRRETAIETLQLLARFQGTRIDAYRREEPGKILHEIRFGELARMKKIPHTPYYGTVDATPLFVIVLAECCRWMGTLEVFDRLQKPLRQALEWIDQFGDHDHDGYVDYESSGTSGLVNQGWKDSGRAIVNTDGRDATPPIALAEVQGYVFLAKIRAADLFDEAGDGSQAARLRTEANDLKKRFNHDFWLADKGFYAMALQAGGRPVESISSNPAQALWSGIVSQERAAAVATRLTAPDMFSGWGVRTLSADERAYNPIGYHVGTVWPHDNSLIVAGLRRYGCDAEAFTIFEGLIRAAPFFREGRLPELFSGYPQRPLGVPVHYPVACHPQAWAAGAVPYMLQTLLGLEPDAFRRRLSIVRPMLPTGVDELRLQRVRVGSAEVDLLFSRSSGTNDVDVKVERLTSDLDVRVESSR